MTSDGEANLRYETWGNLLPEQQKAQPDPLLQRECPIAPFARGSIAWPVRIVLAFCSQLFLFLCWKTWANPVFALHARCIGLSISYGDFRLQLDEQHDTSNGISVNFFCGFPFEAFVESLLTEPEVNEGGPSMTRRPARDPLQDDSRPL
jgi:hypothetical protein